MRASLTPVALQYTTRARGSCCWMASTVVATCRARSVTFAAILCGGSTQELPGEGSYRHMNADHGRVTVCCVSPLPPTPGLLLTPDPQRR